MIDDNTCTGPHASRPLSGNASTKLFSNTSAKNSGSLISTFDFLKSLKKFSKLPEEEIQVLAKYARLETFSVGQYIKNEGDVEGASGFIVVSGLLAMTKTSVSGKELIVELLQPKDFFGLLLMLAGSELPVQLSARPLKKTVVLWVPLVNFTRTLTAHPDIFKEIIVHLLVCLQSSYRLSRGLAHDHVDVRIAAVLSSLAFKFSAHEPATINFTRQQLADLTGTTPETAIRVTRTMQSNGLIDISKPGIIRIINFDALHTLAEE